MHISFLLLTTALQQEKFLVAILINAYFAKNLRLSSLNSWCVKLVNSALVCIDSSGSFWIIFPSSSNLIGTILTTGCSSSWIDKEEFPEAWLQGVPISSRQLFQITLKVYLSLLDHFWANLEPIFRPFRATSRTFFWLILKHFWDNIRPF